ncbi:hypothetical protein EYF80_017988 [Liparis tanakae]|uniref:Uncharacterized protein n=1 Tax=Liparis tanakae TaxID=230148 RepID=A0A4Z2I1G5_9TELE|nr:hypothetical protein EYF80_017988 [Liparis tanakae]
MRWYCEKMLLASQGKSKPQRREAAVVLLIENPAPCFLQQCPAHLHSTHLCCNMERSKMKGCLSSVTWPVRVSSITEEKINQGAGTMECSVVERGSKKAHDLGQLT